MKTGKPENKTIAELCASYEREKWLNVWLGFLAGAAAVLFLLMCVLAAL